MPIHPDVAAQLWRLTPIDTPITEVEDPALHAVWDGFRDALRRGDGYEAPPVDVDEELVENEDGPPVRVRVYRPRGGVRRRVGLVWAHGGGFTGGALDMFEADGVARELAHRTGGVVVSVDYRLANATVHHPLPSDDVRTAWRWTRATADVLGVDSRAVALGGASAGAALAAGVTVRLRDAGEELPAALVLAYPLLHPALPPASPALRRLLENVPPALDFSAFAEAAHNAPVARYLGAPAETADAHALAGLADPTGLPPTLIVDAEYDALRTSGEAFAAALAAKGVDVTLRTAPGMLHGFLDAPPTTAPVAEALRAIADMVRDQEPRPAGAAEMREWIRRLERGETVAPSEWDTAALVARFPYLGDVTITDATAEADGLPVPLRLYTPPGAPLAGAVWVHGGAYIAGDLDRPEAHWVSLELAARGVAVVSVDYRKALGGIRFPAPVADVLAAWDRALDLLADVGVSQEDVQLAGGSAGGTLVSSAVLRLRDGGGRMPASVVLAYPLVHPELPPATDDIAEAIRGLPPEYVFTPEAIGELTRNYVGGSERFRERYAFAGHEDLTGFPRTLVLNAERDTIRASGELIGRQLAAAGVDVIVECQAEITHGHVDHPGREDAFITIDRLARWFAHGS